jgi:hypothetical protein
VSRYVRPPKRTNGRARRFSAYRPADPSMNFSRTLLTVGMVVIVSRACKPKLCDGKQDAWGPPSSWENQSAAFKPGMGCGEREVRLGSDIFVAEMAISAAAGLASTDGSESAACFKLKPYWV